MDVCNSWNRGTKMKDACVMEAVVLRLKRLVHETDSRPSTRSMTGTVSGPHGYPAE